MNEKIVETRQKMKHLFQQSGECAIAISGGVDSMTLATIAHSEIGRAAKLFHAASAAVPADATARLHHYSSQYQWNIEWINAGELDDPAYCANPAARCYHCKSSLYRTIRAVCGDEIPLFSGTNVDDLSDYRPGLVAADENKVRHPYVECGVDKETVRDFAVMNGMDEIAVLPSSPCLSSRIETGISIEPVLLKMIDNIERDIRNSLEVTNVRCRVRKQGVVLELDPERVVALEKDQDIIKRLGLICAGNGMKFQGCEAYQMGSSFIVSE